MPVDVEVGIGDVVAETEEERWEEVVVAEGARRARGVNVSEGNNAEVTAPPVSENVGVGKAVPVELDDSERYPYGSYRSCTPRA